MGEIVIVYTANTLHGGYYSYVNYWKNLFISLNFMVIKNSEVNCILSAF